MSQELIYTSAPQGLKPGSKGFCTVAMTESLSAAWVERLESLSGYRPLFSLGHPQSDRNPVNWSHWRISVGGKTRSVMARIASAGADYSQRSNKFAHFVVLDPTEQASGGPTWLMLAGLMRTSWNDPPKLLPDGPSVNCGDRASAVCAAWKSATGDAAWAAALAESFLKDPSKPVYVVYQPGTEILKLFDESLSLLSLPMRWNVTFSTFFTELPLNLTCAWRAVVAETPAAKEALRMGPRAIVLDLAKLSDEIPSGLLADYARTAVMPAIAETVPAGVPPIQDTVRNSASSAGKRDLMPPKDEEAESESIQESWAARPRKRLVTTIPLKDQDSDPPNGIHQLSPPRERSRRSQVIPHRGVSYLMLFLTSLACAGIGGAIGYQLHVILQNRHKFQPERVTPSRDIALAPSPPATRSDDSVVVDPLRRQNSTMAQQLADNKITIARLTKTVEDLSVRQSQQAAAAQPSNSSISGLTTPSSNPSMPQSLEWTVVADSSFDPGNLPVSLLNDTFDRNHDTKQLALTLPDGTPARIAIAWPNGKTIYDSYDQGHPVRLSQDFQRSNGGISVRVVGTDPQSIAPNPKPHYPVCLTLRDGTLACSWEPTAMTDAADKTLRDSTIIVLDDTDKVIGRFGFPRTEKPILITSPPFKTDVPAWLPVMLSPTPIHNWDGTQNDSGELVLRYVFTDHSSEFMVSLGAKTAKATEVAENNYFVNCDWDKGPGSFIRTARELKIDMDTLLSDNPANVIGFYSKKYRKFSPAISDLIDKYENAWHDKSNAESNEKDAENQAKIASSQEKQASAQKVDECTQQLKNSKQQLDKLKDQLNDQLAPILDRANSLQLDTIGVHVKLLNGVDFRSYRIQNQN